MTRDTGTEALGDFYGFALQAVYKNEGDFITHSNEIHIVDVYYCPICRNVQLFTREPDND